MTIRDRIKELRRVKASELIPHPQNWRKHPAAQKAAVRSILEEIGYAGALLVRQLDGGAYQIIDGHLRAETTPDEEVPVLVVDLDDAEAKKVLATHDPLAAMAETDAAQLDALLREVDTGSEALQKMLAEVADEAGLYQESGEVIEDEAPEPPADPITKAGDLWVLGEHRLLCGDSTSANDVALLMSGRRANLCFTSPPYASQRKYDEASGFKPIDPDVYVSWWGRCQAAIRPHLASDASLIVNIKEHAESGQKHTYVKRLVLEMVDSWSWKWIDEYCWIRQGIPGSAEKMGRFRNAWESVYWFANVEPSFNPRAVMHESNGAFTYADQVAAGKRIGATSQGQGQAKNSPVGHGKGMAYPSNVLDIKKKAETVGHSAAFPVELPAFFIKVHTDSGGLVIEPFCGSGTTLIAAEQLGRRCYGLEISPAYCDVIVQRWEKLTGKKAVLENGKTRTKTDADSDSGAKGKLAGEKKQERAKGRRGARVSA